MKILKLKSLYIFALISSANLFFANKTTVYPDGFKPKEVQDISFTENKGQVHDQNYQARPDVLFGAMAGNMTFHLKTNGVSYQLSKVISYKDVVDERTKEKLREIDQQAIYRIDLSWLNANSNFITSTDKTLEGHTNYYLENCPNGALNVKNYSGVTLHNLYNGINLHYYEKNGQLKHDYIVAPGANYKLIQLKVEGASVSIKKDGSLILNTPLGTIQEGAPIVFQNGKQLKAKWVIKTNDESGPTANGKDTRILSFEIENYKPNQELIIDPITRLWGTYYGDASVEQGLSCATGPFGVVYMAGYTSSNTSTLIATVGSHQTVFGGNNDAFLVQFDANGVRQWATYYGGTGADKGTSCATDVAGSVYMAGSTTSNTGTVIAAAGGHQLTSGGSYDAFLAKFNANGVRQWATFYGGSSDDYGASCATNSAGNVYLAGYTSSTGTAIATVGSHQAVKGSGFDAFVVRFFTNGVRQWGTYYGGTGQDFGYSCATDASGNVYLAGVTGSGTSTVIANTGAHQIQYGGSDDAFIAKFNVNGVRQWGTYYGGSGIETGFSCTTDATDNVYLAGETTNSSGTVIATTGAHQAVNGGGTSDAFIVKFNPSGVRQWATYYGGAAIEQGLSCDTDAAGNVFLVGNTSSSIGTAIATIPAHQSTSGGGPFDAYLVKFNSNGVRQFATYYGGTSNDYGFSCATGTAGTVYMTGYGSSPSGLTTVAAHQTTFNGFSDAFLVKFDDCSTVPANPTGGNVTICANNSATLSATSAGATIKWYISPTSTSVLATGNVYTTPTLSAGTYTYYAEAFTCTSSIARAAISLTVKASPSIAVNSGTICSGSSFTLYPSGANTYTIQGGNTVVSPTANTSYTVIGTGSNGCVSPNFATANLTVNQNPTITVNSGAICSGSSFTLYPSGANTYTIQGGNAIVSPTANTSYTVIGKGSNGCVSSNFATASVTVNQNPTVTVVSNLSLICADQSAILTASGAVSYTFNPGGAGSSIIISPTTTTNYTVTGTDVNGCQNSAVITQTVQACTGNIVHYVSRSIVEVYPNPFFNKITIETKSNQKTIQLYNVLGEHLKTLQIEDEKTEIDLSDLTVGIYFLKTETTTVKVIKY